MMQCDHEMPLLINPNQRLENHAPRSIMHHFCFRFAKP